MKVLHVGPKNYPPAHGGVEKVVFDIIENTNNIDNYVFVEWQQPNNENIRTLPVGILNQIKFILSSIKLNNIDIIHLHKETFIPHSIFLSLLGRKTVLTFHGCGWRVPRWPWYYRIIIYLLDILACILVSKIVFVCKEDYRHFSKLIFWRKLYYVPNGIEVNKITCSDDVTQCVFIGRISPEKNVLRLIEMFSSGNKKLTIYGPFDKHDPSYEVKVMAAIKANPNVMYGGVLAHNAVLPTLATFNTFYNISFSEGMPVSVLEAASVGLNLVLSNIPQHSDLEFPDAAYVNPHEPHLQRNFYIKSIKNKEHVAANYSIQQTVDSYKQLYNTLIGKP
ncbi:MAG TPA: glycosyltransferase family 4 protein [Smithellaceae bacterium]|nr:glycosyltransferase family 4 protein [Smithellaceae bacterium]